MIWRTCPGCSLPVMFDAFGNTDHVCWDSDWSSLLPSLAPDPERRCIIESTADGIGNDWFRRAVLDGALHGQAIVFRPWFDPEGDDDDDDR